MVRILHNIGRAIARYLEKPVTGYEPFTPSDPEHLRGIIEPGDVMLTGSPPGVGPLREGDRVEIEIPGLGILEHGVEDLRGG